MENFLSFFFPFSFPFFFFFDILTIHNDQMSYVKHALDAPHVFFTQLGRSGGGGGPKRPGAQPTNAVSHLLQLKNGNFQTQVFDILIIYTNQISYVKHVLDPLHVSFTLFGCWRGDEVASKRLGHKGISNLFDCACITPMVHPKQSTAIEYKHSLDPLYNTSSPTMAIRTLLTVGLCPFAIGLFILGNRAKGIINWECFWLVFL